MNVDDQLAIFFSKEFPFNKEGLEIFISSFTHKVYKKGSIILTNGATENELRFLDNGIIREFYANNCKEKNTNFYTAPSFLSDFSSFINSIPTKRNQECLSDVNLRVLSKEKFLEFTNQYNCGKQFIETIFHRIVIAKEKEEFNHFIYTAEELYLEIMKTKPNWLLQISQYHIASYLGITPETLSRIRKKTIFLI